MRNNSNWRVPVYKRKVLIEQAVLIGAILLFTVLYRVLPHPPNFAPVAALALFGGVYLDRRLALILPLLAMVLSDLMIGFHNTMVFVYGSILISGIIGVMIRSHKSVLTVGVAALSSSVLFFLITNFGVWAAGILYPKTFDGLISAYLMGIPFFRNTVLGDLLYTGMFFGGYAVVMKVVPYVIPRTQKGEVTGQNNR